MKRAAFSRALAVLCVAALTHFPATARACTVCMGDVNSKTAPAINAAIFLMLGCIGFMLACAAAFGIYLMKHARTPLQPHAEFGAADSGPNDTH